MVRNDGFRFGPGNRYLFIALPATGRAGSTAITIQADDGQSSNSVSFILNVQPPEFARSSDPLAAGGENFEPLWGDFNGDGLLDLLVSPSQIYINRGNGSFGAGIELPQGIVASGATAADFDGDGNLDLLFYSDTAFPRLFRN
ncbi:MAG: VCBS repeat-containing protein, partial [Verrucomicrobia bacterium]